MDGKSSEPALVFCFHLVHERSFLRFSSCYQKQGPCKEALSVLGGKKGEINFSGLFQQLYSSSLKSEFSSTEIFLL